MSGSPSDECFGAVGLFHTASAANIARSVKRKQRMRAAHKAAQRKPKSRAAYFRKRRAADKPPKGPSKRDLVAEFLSHDLSFDQVAVEVGITRKAVERHFEAIRKRLGPQAR